MGGLLAAPVCQGQVCLMRPSSSARLLTCLTCLRLASGRNSLPSLSPSSDPPKHSSAQPAEVPGATNTITHGFAASWLRLASGPAQPATRLSQPHPSPPGLRLAGLSLSSAETGASPAWAQLASSPAPVRLLARPV